MHNPARLTENRVEVTAGLVVASTHRPSVPLFGDSDFEWGYSLSRLGCLWREVRQLEWDRATAAAFQRQLLCCHASQALALVF